MNFFTTNFRLRSSSPAAQALHTNYQQYKITKKGNIIKIIKIAVCYWEQSI
jgi:hypothetical protein